MKRALRIAGIVLGVIVLALIALPFGVNVNSFRPKLEAELSTALGRTVTVGNLSLSILGGSVAAQNLAIADDPTFSQDPFIRAKSLKVGVELLPLIFSRNLHITELTLDKPEITLMRSVSGTWNFSSLGGPAASSTPVTSPADNSAESATANLSVKKLDVKDGRVSISRAGLPRTRVYDSLNITVRDFSFSSSFPFTLSANLPGKGTLKLQGTAGPINSSDASLTALQSQISVKHFDLAESEIGDLSPGISGIANFDGAVSSDGQELRTGGLLQADRLKLVANGAPAGRTVQLKYALEHELHSETGTLTQGDIAMGRAVAQLTGTYQIQGASAVLNMKVNAQGMPVDDLEAMLPALGVVLPSGSRLRGGTLSANLAITGPAASPVVAGPLRLSNSRLTGFDLGSKLSAVSKLSGAQTGSDTSIQNLSANARVAADGVRTDNVNLTVPALGVLTGSGVISPGGALEYKMTANLNGAVVAAITQLAGLGNKGESIPFFIRGTTSNPSFVPDVKGMLTGQIGSQLGNALKNKLQAKAQQKVTPKAFASKTMAPKTQAATPPPQKNSVLNKLTGLFHRKKNPQDPNAKK
jgi:AsmA protein